MVEWKAVRYKAADGVGLIILNRPHRSNAWTGRMAFEYRAAMQLAEADGRVGVIVVTGEGRHFCVGADTRLWGALQRRGSTRAACESRSRSRGTRDIRRTARYSGFRWRWPSR